MDCVRLLPDSVANQIAAGEVIQRPASCLKELVENSLDAGATRIEILLRDAGRTLLQVIDNGKGMSDTDARMAFERHATSKIQTAKDLFTLRTMGFRGEALPSIAAVAQVELTTRSKQDEVGTRIEIDGSQLISQESCDCAQGTSISVKNLFFNVPARRKFLKSDATELRNLLSEFYHIALVYPQVQFTLAHNDEILYSLSVGTIKQRIETIFGSSTRNAYTAQLVEVVSQTELVTIRGFIGKPEHATKNAQQYFFVNGRFMRHPYFHKAVMNAYSGMLAGDSVPSYFLYFDIAPDAIDVNVHPTKTEIKFADEQLIFQILMAVVRESLGKFNIIPSIDFNREGEIEMPLASTSAPQAPRVVVDKNYNPFRPNNTPSPSNWQTLYSPSSSVAGVAHKDSTGAPSSIFNQDLPEAVLPSLLPDGWKPYQYQQKYILCPSPLGLMAIHQHRAHVNILYEQYKTLLMHPSRSSQQLLFPETLDVLQDDKLILQSVLESLRDLGFDIEELSPTAYSIYGVPALLGQTNPVKALQDIIYSIRESGASAQTGFIHPIALSLAQNTAIPVGQTLTDEQMRDLVERLIVLPSYRLTPDGKTVLTIIDINL